MRLKNVNAQCKHHTTTTDRLKPITRCVPRPHRRTAGPGLGQNPGGVSGRPCVIIGRCPVAGEGTEGEHAGQERSIAVPDHEGTAAVSLEKNTSFIGNQKNDEFLYLFEEYMVGFAMKRRLL